MPETNLSSGQPRRLGLLCLAVIVVAVALVWLVFLPWLAQNKAVQARSKRLEEKEIDAGAMYYTDLPMMDETLKSKTFTNRQYFRSE